MVIIEESCNNVANNSRRDNLLFTKNVWAVGLTVLVQPFLPLLRLLREQTPLKPTPVFVAFGLPLFLEEC
jgi:hypothetical protein